MLSCVRSRVDGRKGLAAGGGRQLRAGRNRVDTRGRLAFRVDQQRTHRGDLGFGRVRIRLQTVGERGDGVGRHFNIREKCRTADPPLAVRVAMFMARAAPR